MHLIWVNAAGMPRPSPVSAAGIANLNMQTLKAVVIVSFINRKRVSAVAALVAATALFLAPAENRLRADSCPFCSAINQTFAEQMGSNDVVVVATMTVAPKYDNPDSDELPRASFEISGVVKGSSFVKEGLEFRAVLVGTYEVGQKFIVMGVDPPNVIWSTPLKASQRVIDYVGHLNKLPESGPKRLIFFQDYFEDAESILAFDAYDEFARASYADLIAMKDQMRHDQLIKWIQDPEIAVNRRRLYFTLLGVCGGDQDIPLLEELIASGDRQKQQGLDALVGCYLVLKGEPGLELIEEKLLANEDVDYVDTLSAVSAIRFMGTESTDISRERLCQSLRTLLNRPSLADMIVPDLARWEDWTALDKLVELFRDAKGDTVWLRVAIFQYLRECPLPAAKKYTEELAKIDPKAYERASFFNDFGFSDSPATPAADTGGEKTEADKTSGKQDGGGTSASPESGKASGVKESGGAENDTEDNSQIIGDFSTDNRGTDNRGVGNLSSVLTFDSGTTPVSTGPLQHVDEMPTSESEKTTTVLKPVAEPGAEPVTAPLADPAVPLADPPVADTQVGEVSRPVARNSLSPVAVAGVTRLDPVSRFYSFLLPVGSGMMIFLLLWSVINGWFERLIF